MAKFNFKEIMKKIPDLPTADVTKAFSQFLEYKKESEITARKLKRLEVARETLLKDIDKKYDFYHRLFSAVFEERKQSIDKFFEIINRGIKTNDRELISMGLQNLSNVVSSSPFSNISELGKLMDSGQNIDL
ncbi:hypothetical protein LPTSP3_g31100 [Leptospira kobayashii]|uniref:Uncharacterized protein n=1 Tax=Leptospira kobayashii TaxID=1917830 RepID=A0ABM7UME2_9LEPT|nr:hypothetical protein [Leptospira kobayashii]BDA80180.1 hypothetical protein LPTSP3_g31100 [Leptospira kobayashii]